MCFLLLSEPQFLHISCKSFLDHVQLSDSEVKWQCRNKFSCTQYPPSTWMVTHWHTGVRKEPKCIIPYKVRYIEGWTNLTEIWKPPLKTQFRESLGYFVAWRCSGSSTDAEQAAGLCLNLALEMPVAQLGAVGMIHIALREATVLKGSSIRSKSSLEGGECWICTTVLILHINVELPPKLPWITFIFLLLDIFWSSCYMWILMVILWEAAICLLWYPHN